jgi:hypothetical protein
MGAVSTAPLLTEAASLPVGSLQASSATNARATNKTDLVHISAGGMVVAFDKQHGTLHSITRDGDTFGTNFLGSSDNSNESDPHWTGDLVTTVWDLNTRDWIREEPAGYSSYKSSGKWKRQTTLDSDDIRKISADGQSFRVTYAGKSSNERGIQHHRLSMNYRVSSDASLTWDIEIENVTDRTLEFGELAFPLRANDDYAGPYHGSTASSAIIAGKMPEIQKTLHEQKVFAHAFVAGHSSYVLIQRPRGDAPFLLFHCMEDTSLECIYKVQGAFKGNWIGTDLLAVHSAATRDLRSWDWNPWINGHTSLVLEPGEKKLYQFRFAFISDYSDIQRELGKAGNLGIRILPSMVVQEGTDVHVELKSQADLDDIEIHSDGVELTSRKRTNGATLLTLSFAGRGQKTLKLLYGGGRWTNLHFYCVEDAEQLIKARAKFMAERQFYENPSDRYNRNRLFLPFDYRRGTRIDENTDVWEVGGTDDPGFGDPLFLAEKNAWLPSRQEIERLELYVSDCLFKYIQNPQTYEIRASLYWKERTPSSQWGSWSKKRSEATWRTYNYAFVANIYHAMYRIGANYDVLTQRSATDYLRMCYQTCLKWFTTGPYTKMGLISGSNAVYIVEDLRKEGWNEEYKTLLALMQTCNDGFIRDEYPYASEIEIDETAQHQVYFFTRYFGAHGNSDSERRNTEVRQVLKALRGGDQPVWFCYGNDLFAHPDLRGQIACWHAESINGMCLLRAFEDTGDPSMLVKGYAGVMSVLHNVLPDGMGYGWFNLDPGEFRSEPPKTFEGGPGLWGFLRAAKSYVIEDESFGRVGFGCRVSESANEIRVVPKDGLRKRVMLVSDKLNIEATRGEINVVAFNRASHSLHLEMEDSTGVAKTIQLTIDGMPAGEYALRIRDSESRLQASGAITLSIPVEEATSITLQKI